MMKIKAKIIGEQVWTAENLTLSQFRELSGRNATLKNETSDWVNNESLSSCTSTSIITGKKTCLFNQIAARYLSDSLGDNNLSGWRVPTFQDCNNLFRYIDDACTEDWWTETLAINLRGTYGWPNNGTNKIGFNAIPFPSRMDDGLYVDVGVASWWVIKDYELIGLGIYHDIDVVARCGTSTNTGKPIRLVMDLPNPRIEEGIIYV